MKVNRFVLPLGAFAVLAVVLGIAVKHSPQNSVIKSVLIGKPAPTFSLPNLMDSNSQISNASLHGKPYLLNVWGTLCVACRQEHQSLMQIAALKQVTIVGLDWKDEDADAMAWLNRLGNPYTHIAVDRIGRTAIDYGVYAAPETFLVDENGIIIHKQIGPLSLEIWQRDFVPLLTGQAADKS